MLFRPLPYPLKPRTPLGTERPPPNLTTLIMLGIQVPPTARILLRPLLQLTPIATLPHLAHAAFWFMGGRSVARCIIGVA